MLNRRSEPSDLDAARRVVSRAERQALDRAEELRVEAEELLQASSRHSAEAERRVRTEMAQEVASLRDELEAVSVRATAAELELEQLRTDHADTQAGYDDTFDIAPSYLSVEDAAKLLAESEVIRAQAQDEAERLREKVREESEALLVAVLAAVDKDATIADAAKGEAVRELEAAERLRAEAEAALAATEAEARKALAWAESEARRMVEEGRQEAARLVVEGERRGQMVLDGAVVAADPDLAQVRQSFFEEVEMLRDFIDSMRNRLDDIVDLCGPDTQGGLAAQGGGPLPLGSGTRRFRGSSVA